MHRRIAVIAACAAFSAGCPAQQEAAPAADEPVAAAPPAAPEDDGYRALLAGLPQPGEHPFDAGRALEFAKLSLACVDREYPNKTGDVVNGDDTVKTPRALHPAFYGCFDWHSAVHGHWAMVRLLKTFPGFELEQQIREKLAAHFTEEKIAAEIAYYHGEYHSLFERPYGWGWLLRLQAELATWDDPDGRRWAGILAPLATELAGLTRKYLETLSVPVRDGTHFSTAFALTHIHDYAGAVGDRELADAIERRSRDFYGGDRDCPAAYEPSGEDFISPCLVEADLMRRVLPGDEFATWLERFLPDPGSAAFAPLREPPEVRDPQDPKIGHLIGLSYQRAAAYRGVAGALPAGDPRRAVFERLSAIHRDDAIEKTFASGYGGEHWLASFAIYLFTGSGPYG